MSGQRLGTMETARLIYSTNPQFRTMVDTIATWMRAGVASEAGVRAAANMAADIRRHEISDHFAKGVASGK